MKRGLLLSFILIVSGTLSGCSLDMFSSKPEDTAITRQKNYREGKPGCASFSIPETGLEPKSFRGLVDCFNANESIPELAALVKKSDDRTLLTLTKLLNQAFFQNTAQIGETYIFLQHLDRLGRLAASVQSVTGIFEDAEGLTALVRFLDVARESDLALNPGETSSLAKWFASISPEGIERYFGVFEKFLRSSNWIRIADSFHKKPLTSAEKKQIRESIQAWVSGPTAKTTASLNLLRGFARGEGKGLFQVLLEDRAASARMFEQMFPVSGSSAWIDSFEALRSGLRAPITCMGGSLKFQDPWQQLVGELKRNQGESFYNFSLRRGATQTLVLKECCKIPDSILTGYEAMLGMFGGREGILLSRTLESSIQGGLANRFGEWLDRDSEPLTQIIRVFVSRGISEPLLGLLSEVSDQEWAKIGASVESFAADGHFGRMKGWLSRLDDAELDRVGGLVMDLSRRVSSENALGLADSILEIRTLLRTSNRHSWWEGIRQIITDSLEGRTEIMTLSELSRLEEFKPAIRMIYTMGQDGRLSSMVFDLVRLFASTVKEFPSDALISEKWSDETKLRFSAKPGKSFSLPTYARACSSLKLGMSIESQKRAFYDCLGSAQGGKDLEAWVTQLEKRTATGGGNLAKAVFSQVTSLLKAESKTDSKARWVGSVLRSKTIPSLLDSIVDLNGFQKGRLAQEIRGVFTHLLQLPGVLDRFFARASDYIRSPSFLNVNQWLDQARKTSVARPAGRFRGVVDSNAARSLLVERECLDPGPALEARMAQIQDDVENAVVGWERSGSGSRQEWDEATLLERMGRLKKHLGDPVVAEGVRNLFSELRSRQGADEILNWFQKRSLDIKPVMYIYPGEKEAHVRYMSTLDRLEVMLTAADFEFKRLGLGKSGNYALRFISQIGESWGDEPRSSWPHEIQKKYPAPRSAPTLADTYLEIQSFMSDFSMAMPRVGKCASARRYDPVIGLPDLLSPFWVKANLFNLKQVLPVYEENLPNASGEMQDGMRFLRNLFYFVDASGHAKDRDPSELDKNPINIIRALGRMGFLRTASLYFSFRDLSHRSRDEAALGLAMKLSESSSFSEVFIDLMKGSRWEDTPMFDLARELFRVNRRNPKTFEEFTGAVTPSLALIGDFLQEKSHIESLARGIVDSGFITRRGTITGALAYVEAAGASDFAKKMWRTRATATPESRARLMKLLLTDSELVKALFVSAGGIFASAEARATFIDASRSSELRRLEDSIDALFPKSTWLGGVDPASEELGRMLRVWLADSIRALGPDVMRFQVQDSKSFNEFLSSLARFSESQSFEELEDLYSRHLPR